MSEIVSVWFKSKKTFQKIFATGISSIKLNAYYFNATLYSCLFIFNSPENPLKGSEYVYASWLVIIFFGFIIARFVLPHIYWKNMEWES